MSLTVVELAAEHRGPGPHVATATPRLSWRVATATPAWYQAAYEIEVTGDLEHRSGSEPLGRKLPRGHQGPACRRAGRPATSEKAAWTGLEGRMGRLEGDVHKLLDHFGLVSGDPP